MEFVLIYLLPALAVFFVVYLFLVHRANKRWAERIKQEAEAEERRQAALFTGQHINSLPIIDWEAHRKAQRARASAQSARVEKTRSRRDDDDDIMNPINPLSPLNPVSQLNMVTISTMTERDDEPRFSGGGGSFGGAGSSASWEPSTCNDDSSSRHSSLGSDSGSSYSSSDSSSYSSSDSGSSSSSCD